MRDDIFQINIFQAWGLHPNHYYVRPPYPEDGTGEDQIPEIVTGDTMIAYMCQPSNPFQPIFSWNKRQPGAPFLLSSLLYSDTTLSCS
jgi:hypothetical protein